MLYAADLSWISVYAVKMEHTAAVSLFCTGVLRFIFAVCAGGHISQQLVHCFCYSYFWSHPVCFSWSSRRPAQWTTRLFDLQRALARSQRLFSTAWTDAWLARIVTLNKCNWKCRHTQGTFLVQICLELFVDRELVMTSEYFSSAAKWLTSAYMSHIFSNSYDSHGNVGKIAGCCSSVSYCTHTRWVFLGVIITRARTVHPRTTRYGMHWACSALFVAIARLLLAKSTYLWVLFLLLVRNELCLCPWLPCASTQGESCRTRCIDQTHGRTFING